MDTLGCSKLSRRTAVRLGGAGLAASLVTRVPNRASAQSEPPATFVLVHGAWAGAWIWKKIIPLLRSAGHDVYASTATGMGDRVHLATPEIDLDTFVTDVVNLLEFEDVTNVTLVGWSYGGMTITGVAEQVPERLARIVYLDAFVPADGESGFDVFGVPKEGRAGDFFPVLTDLVQALTGDAVDLDWLMAKLVPQPSATLAQSARLTNPLAAEVPHTFIHCTTNALPPIAAIATRVRDDPAWHYVELAENHFAPVNAPQAMADALLAIV